MKVRPIPTLIDRDLTVPIASVGDEVRIVENVIEGCPANHGIVIDCGAYPNGERWYRVELRGARKRVAPLFRNDEIVQKISLDKEGDQIELEL